MSLKSHFDLLGRKVKDKITGVEGVVTSVCFDLYGCIQATINPGVDKDGKHLESYWYDVNRLEIKEKKRVMDLPPYFAILLAAPEADTGRRRDVPGPAEKAPHGAP